MKNGMAECSVCRSRLVSPSSKAIARAYDNRKIRVSSKQRALNVFLVVGDCMLVGLQVIKSLQFQYYNHVVNHLQFVIYCSNLLKRFRFLFFLCILQPVLVYMSKVDGKFNFSPISVNFLTEIAKVMFALVMLLIEVRF